MKNLTEDQKQALAAQIERTVAEMGLIPEGHRLIVRIERVANRRDPAPEQHRSGQSLKELIRRPLMEVYKDPTLGLHIHERTRYGQFIESVIKDPPGNIDGEIVTLGGFAQNLQKLRARLGDASLTHVELWFNRLGVPYAKRSAFRYARVDD